jgi:hypothetical protein
MKKNANKPVWIHAGKLKLATGETLTIIEGICLETGSSIQLLAGRIEHLPASGSDSGSGLGSGKPRPIVFGVSESEGLTAPNVITGKLVDGLIRLPNRGASRLVFIGAQYARTAVCGEPEITVISHV